jgi:hypothetical protein
MHVRETAVCRLRYVKKYKNAKSYAFEILHENIPVCHKNIEEYRDRIKMIYELVGDFDGPISIDTDTFTHYSRLDFLMNEHSIPKVDVVCINRFMENEPTGLRGLGTHLEHVSVVIVSNVSDITDMKYFMTVENNFRVMSYSGSTIVFCNADVLCNENVVNDTFDVVVPVGPNDLWNISTQIEHVKQNVVGYRNLYIISCDPDVLIDNCITIAEDIFPFSKDTVAKIHGKRSRNGWYYQQLLKLYAGNCISGILPRYLVIDSDTYFLKPIVFTEPDTNKYLYNYDDQLRIAYFIHMEKMGLTKENEYKLHRVAKVSGISYHMMFETKYLNELFCMIEEIYMTKNNTGKKPFYEIFLELVDEQHYDGSGASEYEIYLNFVLKYHTDKVKLRKLNFVDAVWRDEILTYPHGFDYVSCHYYAIPTK